MKEADEITKPRNKVDIGVEGGEIWVIPIFLALEIGLE